MKYISKEKIFNIVCCIKIVEDIDALAKSEYEQVAHGTLDISYVKKIMNCFDEAALETALCLKDECKENGVEAKITAVTLNPGYSEHILKNFPAIGVDETIVLQAESLDLRFQPEITAEILSDYIANNVAYDLLLMGKQAPPANSALVPFYMAEDLKKTCITDVTNLEYRETGIFVEHITRNSTEKMLVKKSVIAIIGNSIHSYIRVPTLREKLKTKKWKPQVIELEETKLPVSNNFVLQYVPDNRMCKVIDADTDVGKANKIIEILTGGKEQ